MNVETNSGSRMVSGSVWMIALRWSIRLVGVVSTAILARLLAPSDFGIVAMAMTVVGMLEILNQTGQKLAIIRHRSPTHEHYDTAWTLSIIVGLVIGGGVLLSAPVASAYFRDARVLPVMQCLALRAVISGFENIGTVDFRRDLRFGKNFSYNIGPKLTAFVITLSAALAWRNYWALVAGIIGSQIALTASSYIVHPYRPRLSLAAVGDIFAFSGWTFLKSTGLYLNFQLDQFAVGGFSGAGAMGRYAVAHDLASSPTQEINDPMVSVLYPVMARVQHDPVQLRNLYLRTFAWSAIICLATSVGVALVAHDMVQLVLGAKWTGAESLIYWLSLSAGLLGLSSGAYTTFDILGKPHLSARMQWVRLVLLAAALGPVAFWFRTIEAIAMTRLLVTAVFLPTLLFAIGREIGVSRDDYIGVLWRPIMAAIAMAAIISAINQIMHPGIFRLIVDVASGACVFSTALVLLWWISGCPEGAEAAGIEFLRSILSVNRRFRATPSTDV